MFKAKMKKDEQKYYVTSIPYHQTAEASNLRTMEEQCALYDPAGKESRHCIDMKCTGHKAYFCFTKSQKPDNAK